MVVCCMAKKKFACLKMGELTGKRKCILFMHAMVPSQMHYICQPPWHLTFEISAKSLCAFMNYVQALKVRLNIVIFGF